MSNLIISEDYSALLADLKARVSSSRLKATKAVNKELLVLYHHIGSEILTRQKQNEWGSKIIDRLSADLLKAFPEMKGFSIRNLKYMRRFAQEYENSKFVQEVLAQLTWYHHITLLEKIPDQEIRIFYIENAIKYGWSRNVMVMQIETELHKRQSKAISNFNQKLELSQSDLANQTLKDPYILRTSNPPCQFK